MTAAAKERTPHPRDRRGRRLSRLQNFYHDGLTEAEQLQLPEAEKLEGLDHEIAMLRVRLKTALGEHPTDVQLLVRGMEILVRAVAQQYRLSPKARRDLAESFAATLNSLGDQLLPAS